MVPPARLPTLLELCSLQYKHILLALVLWAFWLSQATLILGILTPSMPTFLPTDRWEAWLDPKLNVVEEIRKLMDFPEPAAGLRAHPVSTKVNATRNNGADLIVEIDVSEPNTLF